MWTTPVHKVFCKAQRFLLGPLKGATHYRLGEIFLQANITHQPKEGAPNQELKIFFFAYFARWKIFLYAEGTAIVYNECLHNAENLPTATDQLASQSRSSNSQHRQMCYCVKHEKLPLLGKSLSVAEYRYLKLPCLNRQLSGHYYLRKHSKLLFNCLIRPHCTPISHTKHNS